MVDFTLYLGKYIKMKQILWKISQFRQILVFTANLFSLPLGSAATFVTANWWLNSASFALFGGEFRHLASLEISTPPMGLTTPLL